MCHYRGGACGITEVMTWPQWASVEQGQADGPNTTEVHCCKSWKRSMLRYLRASRDALDPDCCKEGLCSPVWQCHPLRAMRRLKAVNSKLLRSVQAFARRESGWAGPHGQRHSSLLLL